MKIIVQKFGGTSVADIEKIKNVANIVQSEINAGSHVIVVVSAMAGITNSLIAQCNDLSKLDDASSLKEYDATIASGEIVTAALLSLHLQSIGIKACSLQGWQVPIKTDNNHRNSQIIEINTDKLLQYLNDGITPVITGFQGISDYGNITTLGKGGSDTSAAIIAAAIKAKRCDIYTDVNGIYTADPRVVHDAKKINEIDIDQLCALCSSGAKVLHPRAALAAKRYGFQLRILSSFNPCIGTITTNIQTNEKKMESRKITAITSNKNLLRINISYDSVNIGHIISQFAAENIVIEQINNFNNGCLILIVNLIDKNKCEKILDKLNQLKFIDSYLIAANISTITIVGFGIKNDLNFINNIIRILTKSKIEINFSDISDLKITLLIDDDNTETAIKLLHQYCFAEET